MRSFWKRRRPSPAIVISLIALFAATSGVAGALPGKNHVDSGDVKNSAIQSADIKNGAVQSVDVRDNSIAGADVRESSLGQVPSAATATNATNATTAASATTAGSAGNATTVGGNKVVQFQLIGPSPIPNTKILDLNGLQLFASCSGGLVSLTATTSVNDSEITSIFHHGDDAIFGNSSAEPFNSNMVFALGNDSNDNGIGQGRYLAGDLRFVHFTYTEEQSIGSNDCLLTGFAIGS